MMYQHKTALLRKIIFLSMAILAAVLSVARIKSAFAQGTPAGFDEIDDYISIKMKELGIPGASLVIVQGDQIVHMKAFGVADASERPVTPQTPFFTGSTGKSFTALAIMQLVEAGKIKLDDPVQTYLPWFQVADTNVSERITVRQLLTQVSGLFGVRTCETDEGEKRRCGFQSLRYEPCGDVKPETMGRLWRWS